MEMVGGVRAVVVVVVASSVAQQPASRSGVRGRSAPARFADPGPEVAEYILQIFQKVLVAFSTCGCSYELLWPNGVSRVFTTLGFLQPDSDIAPFLAVRRLTSKTRFLPGRESRINFGAVIKRLWVRSPPGANFFLLVSVL